MIKCTLTKKGLDIKQISSDSGTLEILDAAFISTKKLVVDGKELASLLESLSFELDSLKKELADIKEKECDCKCCKKECKTPSVVELSSNDKTSSVVEDDKFKVDVKVNVLMDAPALQDAVMEEASKRGRKPKQ